LRISLLAFDDRSHEQVVTWKWLIAKAIATSTVVSCRIRASEPGLFMRVRQEDGEVL
jgi:hypothetical protein